jgi:hypothetical protein
MPGLHNDIYAVETCTSMMRTTARTLTAEKMGRGPGEIVLRFTANAG